MKEKDLYVDFAPQQSVYYVEKEDNSYGPIISGSQLSANYLDDYWLKKRNLEAKLRQQIINNEVSPVYYYMTLQEIGPKDLAGRVGLSTRALLKTCQPKYFNKLSVEKLGLFSEVFNIPVANMFQTFLVKDEDREKISIEQSETKNNLFTIAKISSK